MSLASDLELIEKLQSIDEEAKAKIMVEMIGAYKEKNDARQSTNCRMFDDALNRKTTFTEEWKKLGMSIFRKPGVFPNILSGWDTADEVALLDKAIKIYRKGVKNDA